MRMRDIMNMVEAMFAEEKAKNDPCWKGYEMVGMKKKGDREVPNCVPKKATKKKR